jgi:hypothetical protein
MYGITHAFAALRVAYRDCLIAAMRCALRRPVLLLAGGGAGGTWDCVRVDVGEAMSCGNCKSEVLCAVLSVKPGRVGCG